MKLTAENYYTQAANLEYMSVSQFKQFTKCEEAALAEIAGDYERESSTALLVGSYVDSYYEGTLDSFKAQHPEIFKRDGSLKAEYKQAERIIARCEGDGMFSKYMSGEKQVIMTGEISGVPYKIKIDSYHPGKAIVDLKVIKDLQKIYDPEHGSRLPFVEFWGYDIQGAVYQEIVRQNTGERLPFFIAAATKESVTRIRLLSIPQDRLDCCLAYVEDKSPKYAVLKRGGSSPCRCGRCAWCESTYQIDRIIDYRDLE